LNENNISNIIGEINSSIEKKIILVYDELQSRENSQHLNNDFLNWLRTDKFWILEFQFINIREIENVLNFVFFRNNFLSIKIENGDSRYIMFKFSEAMTNNLEYFSKLNMSFT
jgi:hypothetical protein